MLATTEIMDLGVGGIVALLLFREAAGFIVKYKNGKDNKRENRQLACGWVDEGKQIKKLDAITAKLDNYEKYVAPGITGALKDIKKAIEQQSSLLSSVCTQLKLAAERQKD